MHLTRPACLGLCSNQSRTPHRTVGAGRRLATLPARRAGSRHHGYYITSPGARSRYLTAAAAAAPSSALVAPWTQVEAWPRDRTCGTSCTSCVPATRSAFHMECFFHLLLLSFSQPCACCCWVLATDSAVAGRLFFFLPMTTTRRAAEREDPKRGREDVPGVQR
jgi:hypothetical protein